MKEYVIIGFPVQEELWRMFLAFSYGEFRVFLRAIEMKPDTADKVIWASCSLHNWLRKTRLNTYLHPQAVDREDFNTGNITPGEWRENVNNLQSVHNLGSNNYKCVAEEVRRSYAMYFTEENPLPWQWKKVGITETDM